MFLLDVGVCLTILVVSWQVDGKHLGHSRINNPVVISQVPSAEPEPEPNSTICYGKKDGNCAKDPCHNKYYSCVGHQVTFRHCQKGFVFDLVHNDCTDELNSSACTGRERTISPVADVPFVPQVPSVPEFDCTGLENGLYRGAPCDRTYYACTSGRPSRLQCSGNLYFDNSLQICDVYANVPSCSGLPRTSPLPIVLWSQAEQAAPEPTPAPVNFDCSSLDDGNYGQGCSGIYFSCVDHKASLRECQLNFAYDQSTDQCDQKEYVIACGGQPRVSIQRRDVIEVPRNCTPDSIVKQLKPLLKILKNKGDTCFSTIEMDSIIYCRTPLPTIFTVDAMEPTTSGPG